MSPFSGDPRCHWQCNYVTFLESELNIHTSFVLRVAAGCRASVPQESCTMSIPVAQHVSDAR